MDTTEIRRRFTRVPVARLATVDPASRPHLVPITFALLDERTIVTAVDHKPKRTTSLRRLHNIAANPAVAILADHYADDWDELWWARADGTARIIDRDPTAATADATTSGRTPTADRDTRVAAVAALADRYLQYRQTPPAGPLIVVTVNRWSGWSAKP